MQGGLNAGSAGMSGSAYAAATGTQPTTTTSTQGSSVSDREAIRVGSFSLTMEELLAVAVVVNALGTLTALYMEVS
ncbi:hypothetical protein [Haloarchaeobius litoreus]|uniref:Uncharacterized protein n=1 Tax=Haloarchaeobius litoreus TaxID=755306 RepID=A0ABD6DGY4_9EURY|nr:hypothetical protein [Haloarchaeobius litoreus]